MSRMNYNRPRGGYEQEPWRRDWGEPIKVKPLSDGYKKHHSHRATVREGQGPHYGRLYCLECQVTIQWLTREETEIYKKITRK